MKFTTCKILKFSTSTKVILVLLLFLNFNLLLAQVQIGSDINGEAEGDNSGRAVAMSADGNRVAIAAIGNNEHAGHVRVFDFDGTDWVQVGADIDGEITYDELGTSVAMSADGNRIAVGVPGFEISVGQVKVFEFSNGNWNLLGPPIMGINYFSNSGISVAMSNDGNRVAMSDRGNTSGRITVFDFENGAWMQAGLSIVGEQYADLGYSLDLSGNGTILAAGTPNLNTVITYPSGAKIFEWGNGSWTQRGSDIVEEFEGDQLGRSIAISEDGNRVALGGPLNSEAGNLAGHIRVFDYDGTDWLQVGPDIDGNEEGWLGYNLAMSADGTRVITRTLYAEPGTVRIFDLLGENWVQTGNNIPSFFGYLFQQTGTSLAIDAQGNNIAIGEANSEGSAFDSGVTRVFSLPEMPVTVVEQNGFPISVFPNPNNGPFTVDLGSIFQNVEVRIENSIGQIVQTQKYSSVQKISINLNGTKGLYFFNIQGNDGQYANCKILKN